MSPTLCPECCTIEAGYECDGSCFKPAEVGNPEATPECDATLNTDTAVCFSNSREKNIRRLVRDVGLMNLLPIPNKETP